MRLAMGRISQEKALEPQATSLRPSEVECLRYLVGEGDDWPRYRGREYPASQPAGSFAPMRVAQN